MNSQTIAELRKLFVAPGGNSVQEGGVGSCLMERVGEPADRTMDFVVQTNDLARDGMVIAARAFDAWMGVFMANPICKASHISHGSSGQPTGVGQWRRLSSGEAGMTGSLWFDDTPGSLGPVYHGLYANRTYRAVSVEWLTHKAEMRETVFRDKRLTVPHILEAELFSIDVCAVGSDRGALRRSLSLYEAMSGRSLSPVSQRVFDRIEELLAPSLERLSGERHALGSELDRSARGTVLAGEPEDLARLWKEMEKKNEEAIERAVRRVFNTDPDGMLHNLVLDIVEVCQRQPGQGLYDDARSAPATRGDRVSSELAGLARRFVNGS